MTTVKKRMGRPSIPEEEQKTEKVSVRFTPAEHELLERIVGEFSGKRLAEVIHDMAVEHFRKIDESKPKKPVDKDAEKKINALFDKHDAKQSIFGDNENSEEAEALQSYIDQRIEEAIERKLKTKKAVKA